ncbi:hypothetical protein AGRA3207_003000 [Actinomadura graeca]|uniref:Uncharacterized protein n=1 Tax=Actinomadura graeca TaxID=2750812 RepID=A0ABX8QX83_9ACTN|nr:hypothetical protein [Actinomadura graeca]QXJ22062.1 hypothetical protein AGRA3207_003000 [Actinomadura graeca]
MSNGARHALGVVIGLIVTPVAAGLLTYGTQRLGRATRGAAVLGSSAGGGDKWIGAVLLIGIAVALGLTVGSRLSPMASLVPGATFTAVGALWVLAPHWTVVHTAKDPFPDRLVIGYITLGPNGVFLVIGVLLVAASLVPSRWQARAATRAAGAAPRFGSPPPAPLGPPPGGPVGAARPGGAPPLPGQAPPPGQNVPWPPPGQYGPAPGSPAPPGAPASPGASASPFAPLPAAGSHSPQAGPPASPPSGPPAGSDRRPQASGADEGVGEWTQMYGGDDLRGGGGRS